MGTRSNLFGDVDGSLLGILKIHLRMHAKATPCAQQLNPMPSINIWLHYGSRLDGAHRRLRSMYRLVAYLLVLCIWMRKMNSRFASTAHALDQSI